MFIKGIHHIAIIASDYQLSKKFYTEVLGFGIIAETYRADRNSFKLDLSINGIYQLELFSLPGSPQRASYPEATGLRHLAFAVENIESAVRELALKQVPVQEIRTDEITGKKFAFFNDPDGQPLELYEA